MVKNDIHRGKYLGPLGGCTIQLGLLTADPDGKYGLMEYTTIIALFAYVNGLGCRPVIIVVGIS